MLEYRAAGDNDVDAVCALVNSAYRGESSKKGWTTEADVLGGQRTDPESLREMLRGPGARIELAEEDGRLKACVYLKKQADGACYLGMLTVDPNLQAAGVGKALMARSESLAREWGCSRVRMTVIHSRAELIAFYQRRGYALTGATEEFPMNDPKFGLPKVADLHFVEMVKAL
jgi:GNAT superfamily N-acetyltransferase